MWYVKSGELQGISYKKEPNAAFVEIFKTLLTAKNKVPAIGRLAGVSRKGFREIYSDDNSMYLLTDWELRRAGLRKMSDYDIASEMEELVKLVQNDKEIARELIDTPEDVILGATEIDAPNSRDAEREHWIANEWPNTIDVADDYVWPEYNADGDASLLGA